MSQGEYHLYSKLPGAPHLGIWYFSAKSGSPSGQPVRLAADLVEWVARPKIAGGGTTFLGVGPYKYTSDYRGVFGTNDQVHSKDWSLISSDYEQYYFIADAPKGEMVWTAGEKYDEIKIKPFTGEDNQLFKFVPKIGD